MKQCIPCGQHNEDAMAHCPSCGEASWVDAVSVEPAVPSVVDDGEDPKPAPSKATAKKSG